jgi:hypothetical protein
MLSNPIIIGTLGGVASALLFLAAAKGVGLLAVPLLVFSPLPVLLVALGWMPLASVLAALALVITLALTADVLVGAVAALVIAVPGIAMAYWYTLSRPAEEVGGDTGVVVWFPVQEAFARGLAIFCVCFVIVGLLTGFGQDQFEALMAEVVNTFIQANRANPQNGEILAEIRPEVVDAMAKSIARWMPVSLSATWVTILAFNWSIADRMNRSSGRLARPAPDWPFNLGLAPLYVGVFAVGVLVFMTGGPVAPIGGVVLGAFGAAFMLIGLAVIHAITRGMANRGLLLFAAYGPLLIFGFPAILFVGLGIAETFIGIRARAALRNTN